MHWIVKGWTERLDGGLMTRCLPSATLWKTPDQHSLLGSLLAHSLSTLFTCSFLLRSFTSLALWVLFAGDRGNQVARSLAGRPVCVRPFASFAPPPSASVRPLPSALPRAADTVPSCDVAPAISPPPPPGREGGNKETSWKGWKEGSYWEVGAEQNR